MRADEMYINQVKATKYQVSLNEASDQASYEPSGVSIWGRLTRYFVV